MSLAGEFASLVAKVFSCQGVSCPFEIDRMNTDCMSQISAMDFDILQMMTCRMLRYCPVPVLEHVKTGSVSSQASVTLFPDDHKFVHFDNGVGGTRQQAM